MKVRELMTKKPACCTPETSLRDVAQMMVDCDCGAIPVCEGLSRKPVGVITDRDMVVRAIAAGTDPSTLRAKDCMTAPICTVRDDADLDDCLELMQDRQVRRMLVVDAAGNLCGIVAQADIAQHAGKKETGEMVREVSRPDGVHAHA